MNSSIAIIINSKHKYTDAEYEDICRQYVNIIESIVSNVNTKLELSVKSKRVELNDTLLNSV